MKAQSFMKIWTSKPTEHDEVQVFDLLSYDYTFEKTATKDGEVLGDTKGGNIQIVILGLPTNELLTWMLGSGLQKDGEIVNSEGLIEGAKEHILLKGAQCFNFRINSDGKGIKCILQIQADCIDFGESCFLNG